MQSSVAFFGADDGSVSAGVEIPAATLPVDLALSPDGATVAIVAAGNESGLLGVQVYARGQLENGSGFDCLPATEPPLLPEGDHATNPIAVAFDGRGRLVVQQREPSALVYLGHRIALGGE